MKKPIIWLLLVILILITITAGFFYFQSKNPQQTQKNQISQNLNNSNKTSDSISINQLPPGIQIKDNIEDYSIKIKLLSNKAILRVTNSQIINQNKVNDTIFKKLEIIDGENNLLIAEHISNEIVSSQGVYYFGGDGPLRYAGHAIFEGNNIEYLAYALDDSTGSAPFVYNLIAIITENNQIKLKKIDGWIITDNSPTLSSQFAITPDKAIQMEEGKYIATPMNNRYFNIIAYYEIVGNKIQFANKEFKILRANFTNDEYNIQYKKDQLAKSKSITLYTKADIQSTLTSIDISENAKVKFIGIKYTKPEPNEMANFLTHVIIDGKEGWIEQEELGKIGVYNHLM